MKVLLLDADGVVLEKGEYFSDKYAREHNVPVDDILEFFKGPYLKCQRGEADLKQELVPYLQKWGWEDSVDAFLEYWFTYDVHLKDGAREAITAFKNRGVQCYLASNNEQYRAEYIRQFLESLNLLDGYYYSYQI